VSENSTTPPLTGHSGAAPVADVPAEKSTAARRRRAGNRSGGLHQRQAALIGLGSELPVVSLRTHEDRMAVIEAVVAAVAGGRTSGLVATNSARRRARGPS
jgi:hypothetical protein